MSGWPIPTSNRACARPRRPSPPSCRWPASESASRRWYTAGLPFTQRGELRLFQFESLLQHNLNHAVFTRRGGISPDPWRSLNLGGTVGDAPERVAENKRLALASLNRSPGAVCEGWRGHSSRVLLT